MQSSSIRLCADAVTTASRTHLHLFRGSSRRVPRRAYQGPVRTWRHFSVPSRLQVEGRKLEKSDTTNGKSSEGRRTGLDDAVEQRKEKQIRTPWHRQGPELPPVSRPRSASAMTKGKLLTTPSKLLKIILPLTTVDKNKDRKTVEPLALLVHPTQPLSYLERLIQSELPLIKNEKGEEKIPAVHFRAEDNSQDDIVPSARLREEKDEDEDQEEHDNGQLESTVIDGKAEKTGKLNTTEPSESPSGPATSEPQSYTSSDPEPDDSTQHFVRWSASTEIGDFIRDASRGSQFAVSIESAPREILVGVPSFADRTHYLRSRLRKASRKIEEMASVKKECDILAHRGGQRVAALGFAGLGTWWAAVYVLTFRTDLGWDVMEPVTYLVGLSTLIGGYGWFLYHNREISYRSALNLTISRRQSKLYGQKNFDIARWEALVEEGNALRREIKKVADEYDVEWDERNDAGEEAGKALKEQRESEKSEEKKTKKEEEGGDD